MVDIIVPIKNEAANLPKLCERVDFACKNNNINYLITFIDDHSTDESQKLLAHLQKKYSIQYLRKKGKPGKGFSVLEALKNTSNNNIIMIDGDLQYPPEVIPEIVNKLKNYGVVVANRKFFQSKNIVRKGLSKINAYILGWLLFDFGCDVQSGLKGFRRSVYKHIDTKYVGGWTFDLQLLNAARNMGQKIGTTDIEFAKREYGKSKVSVVKTSFEILINSLIVRLQGANHVFHIPPSKKDSMKSAGIIVRGKKFITHSTLHHSKSAVKTLNILQKNFLYMLVLIFFVCLYFAPFNTILTLVGLVTVLYFSDTVTNLFLVLKSLHKPPEFSFTNNELDTMLESKLPVYTVLCPLYKEHHLLPQFTENISKLHWPKDKLEVLLLLEEDDEMTITEANKMGLPSYFKIVVVPHSLPKTKPKACNYGLNMATGQYIVIYDAEDRPDPYQLLKAYKTFKSSPSNTFCVQAKLNYYNSDQNLLTKLFTAEYSLWFDVVLTGMQSIDTNIPLGGTSNHFRTKNLRLLEGWDAFNVAEDCDLGARLFKKGYRTAIIDSVTYEEATSNLKNWIRQRSRWIKGYMQTYLVHMRNPLQFAQSHKEHMLYFQLTIGGKILSLLINPILWVTTISYFVLHAYVGNTIEQFFPRTIFYFAATSLILGNFLAIFYYMIGCVKREKWHLVKYAFVVPIYWLNISIAGYIALIQIFTKPHYWEKTVHGFHLADSELKKHALKYANSFVDEIKVDKVKKEFIPGFAYQIFSNLAVRIVQTIVFLWFAYHFVITKNGLTHSALAPIYVYLFIMVITHALEKGKEFVNSAHLTKAYSPAFKSVNFILINQLLILSFLVFSLILTTTKIVDSEQIFLTVYVLLSIVHVFSSFLAENILAAALWCSYTLYALIELAVNYFKSSFLPGEAISFFLNSQYSVFVLAVSTLIVLHVVEKTTKQNIYKKAKEFLSAGENLNKFAFRVAITIYTWSGILITYTTWDSESFYKYFILWLLSSGLFMIAVTYIDVLLIKYSFLLHAEIKKRLYQLIAKTVFFSSLYYMIILILSNSLLPAVFGQTAFSIMQFIPVVLIEKIVAIAMYSIAAYDLSKNRNRTLLLSTAVLLLTPFAFLYSQNSIALFTYIPAIITFTWACTYLLSEKAIDPLVIIIKTLNENYFHIKLPKGEENTDYIPNKQLNILIYNWRDTKHVWSGGAEVYIQELAKNWVLQGHSVTIFCGNDRHNKPREEIDGVNIVRKGGLYTVYFWGLIYYVLNQKKGFDVIVDSANGIPFFTPTLSKVTKILLIHHIHQEVFKKYLPSIISNFAMFTEAKLIPLIYKNVPIVTVSQSSAQAIVDLGIKDEDSITIVNPGVNVPDNLLIKEKSKNPLFVYVGRLQSYKNINIALKAFSEILKFYSKAELNIVGYGMELENLRKLAKKLKLGNSVKFLGRVSEEDKIRYFSSAWAAIQPSEIEGWGITVIEANSCGTPVIASDVPGLRDAVKNNETGILVPCGNVEAFKFAMIKIIENSEFRERMSNAAILWSQNYGWDRSAEQFLERIRTEIELKHSTAKTGIPNQQIVVSKQSVSI